MAATADEIYQNKDDSNDCADRNCYIEGSVVIVTRFNAKQWIVLYIRIIFNIT